MLHKSIASFWTVNFVIYASFEVIELTDTGMWELNIYICVYEVSPVFPPGVHEKFYPVPERSYGPGTTDHARRA